MRNVNAGALAVALAWLLAMPRVHAVSQPALSLDAVMRRVGAYVDNYGARASLFVATERYEQRTDGTGSNRNRRRSTVSEVALLEIDAFDGWQQFRDVTHVDGRPLTDRQSRLTDALLSGARGVEEARRMSDESARFNIGLVLRNFNVPTTALFFFATGHHPRFRLRARETTADEWRIDFEETQTPTFIRDPGGASIPTTGSIWIDPGDGTIVRTSIEAAISGEKGQTGIGKIDVTYRLDATLRKWLPARMTEEWSTSAPGGSWARVRGTAEYSNYREFTTSGRIK
jgi:hypothetical protein